MSDNEKKLITVGVTCGPNAYKTLPRLYASLITQTQVDKLKVILCLDGPACNKKDFTAVINRFPEIPSEIIRTTENLGPGGCCDAILYSENLDTPFLTVMDSDDVLYDELAIEYLMSAVKETTVLIESVFVAESKIEDVQRSKGQLPRLRPYNNKGFSPWRFGRLFNVEYCRNNGIKSTNLRTMEDSCWVKQVHLLAEGSPATIEGIDQVTYVWKENPFSITRTGVDDNEYHNEKNEPWYNRFICPYGAVLSSINAVRNVKKKNPFNGNLTRHIVDTMVQTYFSWVENSARDERSADINFFNAKLVWNELYKDIAEDIDDKILTDIYSAHNAGAAQGLLGIVPPVSFPQFMQAVAQAPYGGNDEFKYIISNFPEACIKGCENSGVLDSKEGILKWIVADKRGEFLHPNVDWSEYLKWVEEQKAKEAELVPAEEPEKVEGEVVE